MLKNIKTNFNKLNFEKWKFREENDSDENFASFDDGLKLQIRINKESQNVNYDDDLILKNIVFVETTRANLNKLHMSVMSDYCIVVEGDLSVGKTMLVEYLAKRTRNELIKYQMDDFMDSKSLIGNFVCSDVPGEFLWKAGPLYQVSNYKLNLTLLSHSNQN